jgi:hypothetical protein
MQAPAKINLQLYAGATFQYTLTYLAAGETVNLTGLDARMQVRASYSASTPVFDLTVGDGITLGGEAGTIELGISAEESAALGLKRTAEYVYDLELEDTDGRVTRLIEGTFTIYPEVTR